MSDYVRQHETVQGLGLGVLKPCCQAQPVANLEGANRTEVLGCSLVLAISPTQNKTNDFETGTIWGFPKIRGTFVGVPIIRIIVFWGLYWGPLILGNYHMLVYRD